MRAAAFLSLLALAACGSAPAPSGGGGFPAAARPVAPIVSARFSDEGTRDRLREADLVMDRAGIARGMTVADIGAGEGYYTVRLAARVGPTGRVLAEDVVPATRDALGERVTRERLDNVSVRLGRPSDPMLPQNSFDRILMIHMYHEIGAPYEVLWRLRPSLKAGGRLVIVDADRPTNSHGTPPKLLDCELAAVGYRLVDRAPVRGSDAYLASYVAEGERPEPGAIRACAA